jgi:hypothetical protein
VADKEDRKCYPKAAGARPGARFAQFKLVLLGMFWRLLASFSFSFFDFNESEN